MDFDKADTEAADSFSVPVDIHHFPPSKRGHLMIDVGHFTSDHTDSHAMGFGEYCGTYLTGWCNVPWGDWDGKKRLADAKSRFTEYVAAVTDLHNKSCATDFSSMQVLGLPSLTKTTTQLEEILQWLKVHLGLTDPNAIRNAVDKMIPYFAAWRLPPAAYRYPDQYLSTDDYAAALGKHGVQPDSPAAMVLRGSAEGAAGAGEYPDLHDLRRSRGDG